MFARKLLYCHFKRLPLPIGRQVPIGRDRCPFNVNKLRFYQTKRLLLLVMRKVPAFTGTTCRSSFLRVTVRVSIN